MHNRRKLKIISVFREPLERHISSFFQGHGTRPLRLHQVRDETETLIHQCSVAELAAKFLQELGEQSLICYRESLHDICQQLGIGVEALRFDTQAPFSRVELDSLDLYLMRFDLLFQRPAETLSQLVGRRMQVHPANLAEEKWYAMKYEAFKSALSVPAALLDGLYEAKKDLIELFYHGGYEAQRQRMRQRYGPGDHEKGNLK